MPGKKDISSTQADADSNSVTFEAVESGTVDGQEGTISVLVYSVGTSAMAVNVDQTEGVVDCPRVTPLPNAAEGIIGVASVRGRMTLVVDLSAGAENKPTKQRLILVKGEKQLGLLADRVEGVVSLRKISQKSVSSGRQSPLPKGNGSSVSGLPTVSFFRNGEIEMPIIDAERLVDNA
jgi:chemotaxis signal transduction protein